MWSQFFLAALGGALMLFVPGYVLMRACRVERLVAVAVAPAVSLAGYQVCAIVLAKMGIWANWVSVSLPVMAVALATALVSLVLVGKKKGKAAAQVHLERGVAAERSASRGGVAAARGAHAAPTGKHAQRDGADGVEGTSEPSESWFDCHLPDRCTQRIVLAAFVLASLAVVMFVFVKGLDGPSSYQQSYDNLSHMARIKLFVESGWYAPFGLDMYPDLGDASPSPSHSSGFYPSGWMCIAAMVMSFAQITVPMAENVTNFLFMGLVYPIGACLLGCVLLPRGKWAPVLGACLVLAFGSYPWGMFNFGPVYPNVAGNAFVPAVAACFILLAKSRSGGEAVSLGFAFVAASMGMALTHPNAVFAVAVILAPFAVMMGYRLTGKLPGMWGSKPIRVVVACLVMALIALIWWALYNSSLFSSVVNFGWSAFATKKQVVYDLLVFSLRKTHMQPMLALLAYVGVFYTLRHREYLWLTFSLVIAEVMFAVNACTDGFAKSLLTGFWYADSYRVSAVLAMTALPMTFLGLHAIVQWLRRHTSTEAESVVDRWRLAPKTGAALAVFAALMIAIVYCPNVTVPGRGWVETAFGHLTGQTAYNYDTSRMDDVLNPDERAFLDQVRQVVPEGELILNHPYDGSAFAYGSEDLRVYYRYMGVYRSTSAETDFSRVVRTRLCDVADDREVQDAVKATGAHYLLMLDQGDQDTEDHRRYNVSYDSSQWTGIESVTDKTPGFELLLSEGDMRLYRITAA